MRTPLYLCSWMLRYQGAVAAFVAADILLVRWLGMDHFLGNYIGMALLLHCILNMVAFASITSGLLPLLLGMGVTRRAMVRAVLVLSVFGAALAIALNAAASAASLALLPLTDRTLTLCRYGIRGWPLQILPLLCAGGSGGWMGIRQQYRSPRSAFWTVLVILLTVLLVLGAILQPLFPALPGTLTVVLQLLCLAVAIAFHLLLVRAIRRMTL